MNLPTKEKALETYIQTQGNIQLAAERLSLSEAALISLLSQDPAALQNVVRTSLLITVFSSIHKVQFMLEQRLQHLEPADLAKTYTSLVTQVANLTAAAPPSPLIQNTQINVSETVYNELPPQAREALRLLNQKTVKHLQLPSPILTDDDDD